MQRYHGSSCTSAVNNNALGGISNRDATTTARNDSSSSLSSNYSLNSRRALALVAYRLKCEKESLNSRLGPPDFHPQTLNCPEETLTKEYVQSGYRETVEGLEEAKEISVTQVSNFSKPAVLKCKEAIRKRLRAINESRAQKRKAGQVYGEPLSGSLLSRPGVFPEQKSCGEDFKKRWIEGLSQYHKSLRSLADHVPQGYRKKSLFEVLIRNNVPLLRATWFIKVTYLNQVRPGSSSVSSGSPDRMQVSRTEIWTKDVTDYLQCLLDEFFSRNSSHSILQNRDRSQSMLYSSSAQQKCDPASLSMDSEEPSLHFKWWYVVRILNWHHSEGLILPSQIIDWVFLQFQDKDLLQVMQFLLPIIYGVLETITSCQTYVRKLVDVTVSFLKEPYMGGSDVVDNSLKSYTCAALAEMLQYLILTVPDTFVGLDCFPLPHLMMSTEEDGEHTKSSPGEALRAPRERAFDVKYPSSWFRRVVSSIQKRASYLAKAASPGYSTQNVAKAVQALDKALVQGDVHEAYKFLFEGLSDSSVHEGWIGEVSPCLRSSLKRIRSVNSSLVYSVFLLCEWCTCDFRDFRTSLLHDIKFTGRKDFSQLYVAVRLMKLKLREIHRSEKGTKGSETRTDGNFYGRTIDWRKLEKSCIETSDFFESPGPLHDIIVCWMDQHEAQKGEGSKRVQLLLIELTRSGIFSPLAYARQLLVSGIMDRTGPVVDLDRRKRHHRILKQLSVSCMQDVFDEAENADRSLLLEAMHVYSNERRLILRGLLGDEPKRIKSANSSAKVKRKRPASQRDHSITPPVYQVKSPQSLLEVTNSKSKKDDLDLENLKSSILELLLLPKSAAEVGVVDSQVGQKRSAGVISSKLDNTEGTPGCEECQRAKRHKLGEDKYSLIQGPSSNALDDEDNWWARKEPKSMDSFKVDPPVKPSKQATRGRQKSVRKTQSLAQLAASRIEGSQGASTSHVCDNKVGCPHHRPVPEGEALKSSDGHRSSNGTDIVSIGKMLKHLKFAEKRNIAAWLISSVKQVVEETERISTKGGQLNRTLASVDEKSSARWKLGEDELSVILYLMDMCTEVPLAIKFLIWLFPKALGSLNTPIHGGRNIMMVPKNVESAACEVKEPFLLSAIRRYENVIAAVDLIPDILSSAMQRAAAVLASSSSGRLSGSPTFLYARHLLKKYGNVSSVKEWEKSFKATCDKRFTAELESSKLQNGEFGFSFAVPAGVVDLDDFIRQKISGNRMSRTGSSMRESVQRHVDEAVHHLFGKERKLFGPGAQKNAIEKWDDGYQIAQQIISALMEFMRQTGGAAQEGDPSLVSSAVSAIVSNVGPAIAKMPDFTAVSNHSNFPAPTGSLSFARRVLRIHINCLCLLKEALGERHSRAFEIALATEASSTLAGVLQPGKGARGQFQLSPDAHDSGVNVSNDVPNNSTKVAVGRATKTAAAVSALIIGAIIHGVSSLERMVTVFRLREGLDLVQFVRSSRSHSNGNARASKVENALEVYIHWFRLLVGNCRTVSDGVIVDLLGEPSVLALSRMQRTLPLKLVLPPAYSLFAFMVWRPFIFNFNGNRDEMPQLLQSLTWAISDAIKHTPFRDICLRDTHGFFDLVTSDSTDADFAAILELNGSDRLLKVKAFIPLRARLFLNALVDCKLPHSVSLHDDGSRLSGVNDSKVQYGESETKISDRLVRALDTLQLAKFHWQWVELRLFLSELTLIGKLDSNDTQSVAEAIRSLSPNPDKGGSLENENNFIPIVLTRLLARPDAAPLLSEVVHLFGRSLEDSMLLHVKWFLEGHDVLFGRKSIRQRLLNFAESKSFSTKAQFWKPWGWCHSGSDALGNRGEKRKFETPSVEEGEVVEDDYKRHVKSGSKLSDRETLNISQQFVTERALVELVLPCIDRSSDDSRIRFASELIKQMNNIEQQVSGVASGSSKLTGSSPSGTEVSTNKASNRKSLKGSSPGLARRSAVVAIDSAPSAPAALRASVSLRLQLLVRLLPTICADGDSSGRSSRFWLASVILRLLGSRVVYEDMDLSLNPGRGSPVKEAELQMETCADVSLDLSGKNLFDWLLLVLHALLSSSQPSWLRLKISSKTSAVSSKDFTGFDREALETLQSELDRMQVPDAIRWRIQAAMPVLASNPRTIISCHPPPLSSSILASLQPSVIFPPNQASSLPVKNSVPPMRSASVSATMLGKSKSAAVQSDNNDIEVDPWMLLEDGAGCGPSSSNTAVMGGGDQANLKASSWLKGAVRVRRTDLTYIGAVDGDS